jgi:hypothetical protein
MNVIMFYVALLDVHLGCTAPKTGFQLLWLSLSVSLPQKKRET